jgi:phosphoribosyl-AMP cyclohydrolase / phosphoribosyl-ATP pyrophosphohydrolase
MSNEQLPEFDKFPDGLVPVIVQHAQDGRVLMLGYMNSEALQHTRSTGLVTFYSRSKQRLWTKGESSGNHLRLEKILLDCDADALLVMARPEGPTCHTGSASCFGDDLAAHFGLHRLQHIVQVARTKDPTKSYTAQLLQGPLAKVAQKVGEEAVEVVLEAMQDDADRFCNEAADLLYHLTVLLAAKKIELDEVLQVLRGRERA